MNTSMYLIPLFTITLLFSSGGLFADDVQNDQEVQPKIQIALLLDTSSSMSGLLDQARTHMWTVVNQFIDADRGGKKPVLEVALLEYGAGRLNADAGYTRLVVPLTTNLDQIFEDLLKLTAVGRPGGSNENCGQIIDLAVRELAWSNSDKDLKCIFIAGNESFTQGAIDFRQACRDSIKASVTVSTIFCGNHQEGIRLQWKEASLLADGTYLSIDHNRVIRQLAAPQDKELETLNLELNKTYLAYGDKNRRRQSVNQQLEQDLATAELAPESFAARAQYKSSSLYRNEQWDLVDGVKSGHITLADLDDDDLPESIRELPTGEREKRVTELATRRVKLQAKINQLGQRRTKFMQESRNRQNSVPRAAGVSAGENKSLDQALIEAVRDQARKKGVKLKS